MNIGSICKRNTVTIDYDMSLLFVARRARR